MDYFLGEKIHDGIVIAAAAKVSHEFGIASFSPERLRRFAEQIRIAPECPEIDQVILVCERVPAEVLRSAIVGLEIAGLAIQNNLPPDAALGLPTVADLGPDFFNEVSEFDILILDGSRGRVFVNPNAMILARYQEQSQKSRRYFLEGVHLPAKMASTNKVVQVPAITGSEPAIHEAIRNGADAIYVPAENEIFGSSDLEKFQTSDEQMATLARIIDMTGGLPIFLDVPLINLALTALMRAAAKAPIHLIMEAPNEIEETLNQIQNTASYLQEEDIPFGEVRIERAFSEITPGMPMPDDMNELAGILIRSDLFNFAMADLLLLLGLAQRSGKPAMIVLDEPEARTNEDWKLILADPLSFGFSWIAVPAPAIVEVKDAIREL